MRQLQTTAGPAAVARRRGQQRGGIAVEFALVVPMFLCALGLIMNVGLSFYARFQLTNYAAAAARYCVSQVNVNQNGLSGCVGGYMNSLDLVHVEGLCGGAPTAMAEVLNGPNNNPDMKVLAVQVQCNVLWSAFANVVSQDSRETWTINVRASMPFQAF